MTIGDLIYNLTDQTKRVIREREKLQKKLINNKYAVAFNNTCIYIYTSIFLEALTIKYEGTFCFWMFFVYILDGSDDLLGFCFQVKDEIAERHLSHLCYYIGTWRFGLH